MPRWAAVRTFDRWLRDAATADPDERDRQLIAWDQAPLARAAHPREEHLIPLMVIAGAAVPTGARPPTTVRSRGCGCRRTSSAPPEPGRRP